MCATCGCATPEDDQDDDFNIRWSQIEDAAYAAGISTDLVVRNIEQMLRRADLTPVARLEPKAKNPSPTEQTTPAVAPPQAV